MGQQPGPHFYLQLLSLHQQRQHFGGQIVDVYVVDATNVRNAITQSIREPLYRARVRTSSVVLDLDFRGFGYSAYVAEFLHAPTSLKSAFSKPHFGPFSSLRPH